MTAESFAKWTIAKAARKQAEAEARVKAEQAKKKGGKGLCKYFFHMIPLSSISISLVLSVFIPNYLSLVLPSRSLFVAVSLYPSHFTLITSTPLKFSLYISHPLKPKLIYNFDLRMMNNKKESHYLIYDDKP